MLEADPVDADRSSDTDVSDDASSSSEAHHASELTPATCLAVASVPAVLAGVALWRWQCAALSVLFWGPAVRLWRNAASTDHHPGLAPSSSGDRAPRRRSTERRHHWGSRDALARAFFGGFYVIFGAATAVAAVAAGLTLRVVTWTVGLLLAHPRRARSIDARYAVSELVGLACACVAFVASDELCRGAFVPLMTRWCYRQHSSSGTTTTTTTTTSRARRRERVAASMTTTAGYAAAHATGALCGFVALSPALRPAVASGWRLWYGFAFAAGAAPLAVFATYARTLDRELRAVRARRNDDDESDVTTRQTGAPPSSRVGLAVVTLRAGYAVAFLGCLALLGRHPVAPLVGIAPGVLLIYRGVGASLRSAETSADDAAVVRDVTSVRRALLGVGLPLVDVCGSSSSPTGGRRRRCRHPAAYEGVVDLDDDDDDDDPRSGASSPSRRPPPSASSFELTATSKAVFDALGGGASVVEGAVQLPRNPLPTLAFDDRTFAGAPQTPTDVVEL